MRFLLLPLFLCLSHFVYPQDSQDSENGLLDLLVQIEKKDNELKSDAGQTLSGANLALRDSSELAWTNLGTRTPLEWWNSDLNDTTFIHVLPNAARYVFGVSVFPLTDSEKVLVAAATDSDAKVMEAAALAAGEAARSGISDAAEAEKAAASAQDKVRESARKEIEAVNESIKTVGAISDITHAKINAEGRWAAIVSRFRGPAPEWFEFNVKTRSEIIADYQYAIEDLEKELRWPCFLEIKPEFATLVNDKLIVSEDVRGSNTSVSKVALTWNELIDVISTIPKSRPVPKADAPKPTEGATPVPELPDSPPYNSDEIAEITNEIVGRLSKQLGDIIGVAESKTKLGEIAELLKSVQRYRAAIYSTEWTARNAAFLKNKDDFVTLQTKFTSANPAESATAREALNVHWGIMQQEIASLSTLKWRLNQCEIARDHALTQLSTAIRNNRPALLENVSALIGQRLARTIELWDDKNMVRNVDWNETTLLEESKRSLLRNEMAKSLSSIHATTSQISEVPYELLLKGRLDREAKTMNAATVDLQILINSISEEKGETPDEELSLCATGHRVSMKNNWHLEIAKKKVRRIVLYCYEIEFDSDVVFELEPQCEVFIVSHRMIGEPPTVILKDTTAFFNFFVTDRFGRSMPCRTAGPGSITALAGGRDGRASGIAQDAWRWLAGDLPLLKNRMTKYWIEVWGYYLGNDLGIGVGNSDRRVVYVDLAGLPRTLFLDNETETSTKLDALRKELFDGSLEFVSDSKSKRRIPVFIDKSFAEGAGRVYQLPDEIVVLPRGDFGNFLGEWLPTDGVASKRTLHLTIHARNSVFGSQRAKSVLKRRFGPNIDIVDIEDAENLRIVFLTDGDSPKVDTNGHDATFSPPDNDDANFARFPPMNQIELIKNWNLWTSGRKSSVSLVVERKNDGDDYTLVKNSSYVLPVDFGRSSIEPKISKSMSGRSLLVTNQSPNNILLEYAITDPDFDYYDLQNRALPKGVEDEGVVTDTLATEFKLATVRDFSSERPFDLFALRAGFDGIEYYSFDLAGLRGARFPNKSLQPGSGPAIDHHKSTIHFQSRRKDESDVVLVDPRFFSGKWSSFFSRTLVANESEYAFAAETDTTIVAVFKCVPRFGSSFVEADTSFEVIYDLSKPLDKRLLQDLATDEFQRRLTTAIEKSGKE